jgi:hypothetical protein
MSYFYKGKLVDNPSNWISFDNITNIINLVKSKKWCWTKNSRCKYIEVRIDMRDGNCLVRDRNGIDISLEELLKQ